MHLEPARGGERGVDGAKFLEHHVDQQLNGCTLSLQGGGEENGDIMIMLAWSGEGKNQGAEAGCGARVEPVGKRKESTLLQRLECLLSLVVRRQVPTLCALAYHLPCKRTQPLIPAAIGKSSGAPLCKSAAAACRIRH